MASAIKQVLHKRMYDSARGHDVVSLKILVPTWKKLEGYRKYPEELGHSVKTYSTKASVKTSINILFLW